MRPGTGLPLSVTDWKQERKACKAREWLKSKSKLTSILGVSINRSLATIVVPYEQSHCLLQSLHTARETSALPFEPAQICAQIGVYALNCVRIGFAFRDDMAAFYGPIQIGI